MRDHDDVEKALGATEQCTEMLRSAIVAGEFPPGLRLPSERELAARFKVGRITVRCALARIEAEHLVSVKQGSGYFVRDYRRHGGPDLIGTLAALATRSDDRIEIMRDLLQVRRHLARATLERLFDVVAAESHALDAADAALQRFEELTRTKKTTISQLAEADLEIVAQLVIATKSAVLQLCFNPVAALLRDLPELQAAMYRDPETNAGAFRSLIEITKLRQTRHIPVFVDMLAKRDDATIAHLSNASTSKKKKAKKS